MKKLGLAVGLVLGLLLASWLPVQAQSMQILPGGCGTGAPTSGSQGAFVDPKGNLCTITNADSLTATAAVSGGVQAKVGAGTLVTLQVTSGASAGFVLLFDSATIPADGAVTPKFCQTLAATSSFLLPDITTSFQFGMAIVFSTTGCYTKTASATAFIAYGVQ